jgi:hypothetical protein
MKSQCTDGRTSSVQTQTNRQETQKTAKWPSEELKFPSDLFVKTKKNVTKNKHRQTHRKPWGVLNVTDGTIWWKSQCTDGRTSSVRTEQKKCYRKKTNKQTENTQKLTGGTSEGLNILTLNVTDNNLMEISMYGRTDFVRPYETKKILQTNTDKHTENLGVYIWRNWN